MSFTFVQAGKQNENKFHITFSIHPDEWKARAYCLSDLTIKTMRFTHTPQGGKEILRGTPNNVTGVSYT